MPGLWGGHAMVSNRSCLPAQQVYEAVLMEDVSE